MGISLVLSYLIGIAVGVVQAAPQYPFPTDVLVNIVTSAHHLGAAMVTSRTHRMTEVLNGDLAELLDQTITHYQSEKLKDATAVSS